MPSPLLLSLTKRACTHLLAGRAGAPSTSDELWHLLERRQIGPCFPSMPPAQPPFPILLLHSIRAMALCDHVIFRRLRGLAKRTREESELQQGITAQKGRKKDGSEGKDGL